MHCCSGVKLQEEHYRFSRRDGTGIFFVEAGDAEVFLSNLQFSAASPTFVAGQSSSAVSL